jgi:glycosyltransferase A (GT-A) superfamily protein (DUF2064 family)
VQIVVIAHQPPAGRAATRWCPAGEADQAAAVAQAALADTLDVAGATRAMRRTLVLSGRYDPPPGWCVAAQRGDGPGERLANAFLDTAMPGVATLLIGMDTPQITPALLDRVALVLGGADAVLGPAEDGGWWCLALRDPAQAVVLRDIPTSTSDTHALTSAAFLARRLVVRPTARLRDVHTPSDALAVARACPHGRFAAAVARHFPALTSSDTAGRDRRASD